MGWWGGMRAESRLGIVETVSAEDSVERGSRNLPGFSLTCQLMKRAGATWPITPLCTCTIPKYLQRSAFMANLKSSILKSRHKFLSVCLSAYEEIRKTNAIRQ